MNFVYKGNRKIIQVNEFDSEKVATMQLKMSFERS